MCNSRRFSVLAFILYFSFCAYSQNTEYKTSKWQGDSPLIDGFFEDAMWQQVQWETGFTQNSPDNGNSPSQNTAFKVIYDDESIYVAIKAYDTEPDKIDSRMSRRDGWIGDRLAVEFDSYNDNRTGFVFCVSSAGVKNDGVITREDGLPDGTIDPIWHVKTAVVNDGWNAEMRIPLSQLKYSSDQVQEWGIQVVRYVFREQEYDTWVHIPSTESGWVNHYGKLTGIKNIKPKRQIETAPFMLMSGDFDKNRDWNPLEKVNQYKVDVGVNGKIGLNNYLTLDYAINPDFGQVEADPAQLNLTEFETFYQEKRPFFLEGRNIMSFPVQEKGINNLFYSRRIGRRPQGNPHLNPGEYSESPDRTRILAALKLTGKTKNGWSIGVIESVTNQEQIRVGNLDDERKVAVEPYTNYHVTRLEKDFNDGNTVVGGIFTSTNRLINDENFNDFLHSAVSGGINMNHYFNKRRHYVGFKLNTSKIDGSEKAILNQQLSSRRYFQRPDVDYMEINPDRTSLSGTSGLFSIGRRTNGGFNYAFSTSWISPEFEINDLGYLRTANLVNQSLMASYTITKPHLIFKQSSYQLTQATAWDFGGVNNSQSYEYNGVFLFKNLWTLTYSLSRTPVNIKPTSMRGGPALHDVGFTEYDFDLVTNRSKKVLGGLHGWRAINDSDTGESWEMSGRIHYRPIDALDIGMAAYYGNFHQDLHYIRTIKFEDNMNYLYGAIDQKLVNFIVRIQYNLSPDFTIQYYGTSYFTSGNIYDFKNVILPDADIYQNRFHLYEENEVSYASSGNNYTIDETNTGQSFEFSNPNFNLRDFRSNLVLRWEYKPGSSVYLVWSQSRYSLDSIGDLYFNQSVNDLISVSGRNIIMLKLSYRFQR